ncbi:hypothetical protein N6H14_30645 [Paenibacillus sp. CC-CFT747]|nr:hypothetical protein N6H14_30645 [Paenibacillus sp. CC-CFT747]
MNEGYLASLLMVLTMILLATGWKEVFLRQVSPRVIGLFMVGWIALSPFSFPFAGSRISLVVPLLIAGASGALFRMEGLLDRLQVILSGTLCAILVYLYTEMTRLAPAAVLLSPELDKGLLLSLTMPLLQREALRQLTALTIGLLFAHWLLSLPLLGTAKVLGGAGFQDRWWLVVCLTRLITEAAWGLAVVGKRLASLVWKERRE